jgi:ubiquitin carboxyl-terminal hydrolase L5
MSSNNSHSGPEWCLIESDPAVFTELLEMLGCHEIEFQELYSLDDAALNELQQQTGAVYGLIFLFEWKSDTQNEHAASQQPVAEEEIPSTLFFAHQVTTNACATQAVLSVLLNAVGENKLNESQLGKVLSDFRSFTMEFPPQLKGVAVSSSEEIRAAHNSFTAQDSFLSADKHYDRDASNTEAFHFVAYVPHGSGVYELDGLQSGPMVVGDIGTASDGADDWLAVARTAIQERMRQTGADAGAVKFNLMAVIQDKRIKLREMLVRQSTTGSSEMEEDSSADDDNTTSMSHPHALAAALLEQEEAKRAVWKLENQRRRHNYLPAAVQLLRELAVSQQLAELVSAAKEKQQGKQERQRAAALLKKQTSSSS